MRRSAPSRIGRLLLGTGLVVILGLMGATDFAVKFAIPILADHSSASLVGVLVGSLLGGIALARPLFRRLGRPFVPSDVDESRSSLVDQAGRDARIVRRIGRGSRLTAGVGLVVGLALIRLAAVEAAAVRQPLALRTFLLPVATGIAGYGSGLAATCVLTPASFLTGPAGRPYLDKIGTGSVLVARVACILFVVVFIPLILLLIGLLLMPPLGDGGD